MSDPRFQTELRDVPELPNVREFHVAGRVTYDEAPAFRTRLLGEVSRSRASVLVVYLGGVEEMDTAGAAVLVESLIQGRKRDLQMLLCSPSESVLRMFRLSGLEDVLNRCCATPDETRRRLLE